MMRILAAATLALLIAAHAPGCAGQEASALVTIKTPPKEARQHHVLRHEKDNIIHYEVTTIDRIAEHVDELVLLVSDLPHGRFMLRMRHDYENQTVMYELSDVQRRDYVRTSFKMPFTAKTRSGMLTEARNSPNVSMLPALLAITTNGGEWSSIDAEAKDRQRMRELRYSIRPTVSFFLLEAAERMRGGLFSTTNGKIFYDLIGRYLVYQDSDDMTSELQEVQVDPACDFDAAFGYPCSEAQLKRIKEAADAGKTLPFY